MGENYDPFLLYMVSTKTSQKFELFFSLLNFICEFTPSTYVII